MTTADLAEGRRLLAEATPAPWESANGTSRFMYMEGIVAELEEGVGVVFKPNYNIKCATKNMVAVCWLRNNGQALLDAAERAEKLQAFKDWTHAYLDAHSVPHHPPGTHGAAGCRIGDRMDWLMAKLADAERLDPEGFAADTIYKLEAELRVSKAECVRLREDAEGLNRMLRETGQGQGAIDAYVAQCEEIDRLREERDRIIGTARYTCGCQAVRSDKVRAFCPVHAKGLALPANEETTDG